MYADAVERRARYRYYFSDSPARVRAELLSEGGAGLNRATQHAQQGPKTLFIYTGDRWKCYVPAERSHSAEPLNELLIHHGNRQGRLAFETARANAAPLNPIMLQCFDPGQSAKELTEVRWSELLRFVHPPNDEGAPAEVAKASDEALLELSPPPDPKLGAPFFRLRLWLDVRRGYCPRRMLIEVSRLNELSGARYSNPIVSAEWDDISSVAAVGDLPMRCTVHQYMEYLTVDEKEPWEKWPAQAFEVATVEMRWSEVRVGDRLGDDLFDVVPPPGTNVIDEVGKVNYVVGSAGQELKKTALEFRETYSRPPSADQVHSFKGGWSRLALYAVVAGVIATAMAIYFRARRSRVAS